MPMRPEACDHVRRRLVRPSLVGSFVLSALEDDRAARLDQAHRTLTARLQTSGVYLFLIAISCLYYALNAQHVLGHLDLGWHLAAGDLIRERGSIPFQDPWSFTLGDRQWFNATWLWDSAASIVFQYAGLRGLMLLAVACGALIAGYLASICSRTGASAAAVGISALAACLLYPSYATSPNVYLAAAPNMATMLFAVIFYGEALRRSRCLWLPLIMVLWVNLHGGFVLGFLILGAFGATALLRRDWPGVRIYLLTGFGCFAAIFINPLGWHIYSGVVTTVGHFVQAHITEWMTYFDNLTLPGSIPGIVYIAIFAALELRFGSTSRAPLETRLLPWLFLFLGIYQFRYMSFFFLFSTIPLALHIDRLLPKLDDVKVRKALFGAGVIGACALPFAFLQAKPTLAYPPLLSEQDASWIKTHLAHKRLLNHWNTGGLLIFYARGTVPVFVDGRAATAYPDELLRDYFRLIQIDINAATWDGLLAKYRIEAVLWPKAHDELRHFLVDQRGWKEVYAGTYESVYVKP